MIEDKLPQTLDEVREAIDGLDKELIELLKFLKKQNYEKLEKVIEKRIKYYGLSDSFKNGYEFYGCNSYDGLGKYNKEKFLKLREDYNDEKNEISPEDKVLLVKQYRAAIDCDTYEIPAGILDKGDQDKLLEGAKRELEEETTYQAAHWQNLGDFYGLEASVVD